MKILIIILLIAFKNSMSIAACSILNSNGSLAPSKGDLLSLMLAQTATCPGNVQEFNSLLASHNLKRSPSMVANRGRNNPKLGSFSLFETVTGQNIGPGEFYFGHFTTKHHNQIILDQSSAQGKLLIELIAWDYQDKVFNFYELIGQNSTSAQWFYRGNSFDALADNKNLHRAGMPKFGSRMRCSACHNSGGPIMKELSFPHNDWWTQARDLSFGANTSSIELSNYLKQLVPAEKFAHAVKTGINKLESSSSYQAAKSSLTLQEQLRPLFCDVEINLESSTVPLESYANINIPSASLLSPLLGSVSRSITKVDYIQYLTMYKMNFPETNLPDADHAWLTPVKSYVDLLSIMALIKKQVISEAFAKAVLMVDYANPVFSPTRCRLLSLVPNYPGPNWQERVLQNLPQDMTFKTNAFEKLLQVRAAVFSSEISKNSKGQILEPGFRVIFPTPIPGGIR